MGERSEMTDTTHSTWVHHYISSNDWLTFHSEWHCDSDLAEVVAADKGVFAGVSQLGGLDGEHCGVEVGFLLGDVDLIAAHLVL